MSSKFHERANGDARRSKGFRNKWQAEHDGVWKKNRKGWVWSESVSKEVKTQAPVPVTPSRTSTTRRSVDGM